jgi:tetratricopeptide (TPR) repeat protein
LLTSQRRFREASELWRAASIQEPDNVWIWAGLGNCCEQQNDPGRAAECYSACTALNPDYYGWYFRRGRLRMREGDYQAAREDFARAVEIKTDHPESHANLAIVELELKAFKASIRSMRHAIECGFIEPQAYFVLAQAYDQLGDEAAAREARQNGMTAKPQSAEAWVARAVAKVDSSPDEAIQDLNQALVQNAHCAEAWESKAHVLAERLQRSDEALPVLDRAVELFPESASLRACRGVVAARLHRFDQARSDAEHAMQLDRSPAVLYQVAGIHAWLSSKTSDDAVQAIELLSAALRQGYGADLLDSDPDLAPLRSRRDFIELRDAVAKLQRRRFE